MLRVDVGIPCIWCVLLAPGSSPGSARFRVRFTRLGDGNGPRLNRSVYRTTVVPLSFAWSRHWPHPLHALRNPGLGDRRAGAHHCQRSGSARWLQIDGQPPMSFQQPGLVCRRSSSSVWLSVRTLRGSVFAACSLGRLSAAAQSDSPRLLSAHLVVCRRVVA